MIATHVSERSGLDGSILRDGAGAPATETAGRPGRRRGVLARLHAWLDGALGDLPQPEPHLREPDDGRVDHVGYVILDPMHRPGLSPAVREAASRFLSCLPPQASIPSTRRIGDHGIEFRWQTPGPRTLRVVIGTDGMLIFHAGLGRSGRLEGAEPVGQAPSPALAYAFDQVFTTLRLPPEPAGQNAVSREPAGPVTAPPERA